MTTPALTPRLARARLALEGLSIGDAFGERFFLEPGIAARMIDLRALPAPPWRYTDDSAMALSIYQVLQEREHIDQDRLAQLFARRYAAEPSRGYGGGAHDILSQIGRGRPWRDAAGSVFDGSGSYGNGGAMRVAPVGAYFADDPERASAEARASAEVTHSHTEGQAGAVAIAVAAVWAWNARADDSPDVDALFELVIEHTPPGTTCDGIARAREIDRAAPVGHAAKELGTGQFVSSQDTVPFCVWCIARHPTDYVTAMWSTVAGLGDRDTTCAIVGGVVALAAGETNIPTDWRDAREPLVFGA